MTAVFMTEWAEDKLKATIKDNLPITLELLEELEVWEYIFWVVAMRQVNDDIKNKFYLYVLERDIIKLYNSKAKTEEITFNTIIEFFPDFLEKYFANSLFMV